jgi:hypothetical protein
MAVKTYTKDESMKLSDNFSVSEFACHGSGCCSTVLIDERLVTYVQKIRDHFGVPVKISSGYRCPTHNKNIGSSTSSRHAKGQAADIVVEGVAPAKVAAYAESIGIKGIGLYETKKDGFFVHVDTRTRKSFWYGQAQAHRSTFIEAPTTDTTKEEKPVPVASYGLTDFIKDIQKATGAKVDGKAGRETLSKTVTLSRKKNNSHPAVMAVQKYLMALGYREIGKADGVAGVKFTSAVAHFQQDNGCAIDGEITAKCKTWKKLLGM